MIFAPMWNLDKKAISFCQEKIGNKTVSWTQLENMTATGVEYKETSEESGELHAVIVCTRESMSLKQYNLPKKSTELLAYKCNQSLVQH